MTDFGYSPDYEVYLTRNNGVQIVTNDLSLIILREMRYHEISPTNIAMELELSKSTIQANITKLLHMGIVSQEENVEDSRGVVYRIDAAQLFSSNMDIKWQLYARMASASRIIREGKCTSREDLSLYGVSLTESGLNIVQGLFSVGAALTMNDSIYSNWAIMKDKMVKEASEHQIALSIEERKGLKLTMVSMNDTDISDVPLIVVPMLGGIVSHSKALFGYNLSYDVQLNVDNNGRQVTMSLEPFVGQDYRREPFILKNLSDYKVSQPFSIYSINGDATLFTNPTMMTVLYVLSEDDYSVNELAEIIGIPKATIYASLMKLTEMGAVAIGKGESGPKKYTLLADPILFCKDPETTDCSALNEIKSKFARGEIDYYSAAISYAMEAINCMGIHFDKMFTRAGRNTALSVIDLHPDIKAQDMIDVACWMVSYPDTAEIVSYIPLKLCVTLAPDTLWGSWPADFVRGFVDMGLQKLTGDKYKVIVETVRNAKPR